MNINLTRFRTTRWATDGILKIDNQRICETIEHRTCHLPAGQYTVTFRPDPNHYNQDTPVLQSSPSGESEGGRKAPITYGNGVQAPTKLPHHAILLGEMVCSGFVKHGPVIWRRFTDRLLKHRRRHPDDPITLTIVHSS